MRHARLSVLATRAVMLAVLAGCGNSVDAPGDWEDGPPDELTDTPYISAVASGFPGCERAQVASVNASTASGVNIAANAVDGSLATRWSGYGAGAAITLDLGSSRTVCGVAIAWYRGKLRRSPFVVAASNDGSSFGDVFAGTSSGASNQPERVDFDDVDARYLRITVNGNTENKWASITEIEVTAAQPTEPPEAAEQTLFGDAVPQPDQRTSDDGAAVELGVIFEAAQPGLVAAVRYYRAAANPSGYIAHLWNAQGVLLASAEGADGVLPGWQEARFVTPVAIDAATRYVASYYTSNGGYPASDDFSSAVTRGDLTAPVGAGVYAYGGGFPSSRYRSSNYWVDVVFVPSIAPPPPPPPGPGPTPTAILSWSPSAGATGYRVYFGTTSGSYLQPFGSGTSVGDVTSHTIEGLELGRQYFFTVTATDDAGNESPYAIEVTKLIR